jgi:hypothetical protein
MLTTGLTVFLGVFLISMISFANGLGSGLV